MLRIFKHTGRGHYIGSVIIVMTNTVSEAHSMIRDELDSVGLKHEDLNIIELESTKKCIIYSHNGDY